MDCNCARNRGYNTTEIAERFDGGAGVVESEITGAKQESR